MSKEEQKKINTEKIEKFYSVINDINSIKELKELELEKLEEELEEKLEEEEKELVEHYIKSKAYQLCFSEEQKSTYSYYFNYNKNGSKTININGAIKNFINKEYGVKLKDINGSYNEYSRPLAFNSVLTICLEHNFFHNIKREEENA